MTQPFIAVPARGVDAHGLTLSIPVVGSTDRATMRSEANQGDIVAPAFARQLAYIMLSADRTHIGGAGIADMAVVGPYNGLRIFSPIFEQMPERVRHVAIAQVPAFAATVIHDAVVFLG